MAIRYNPLNLGDAELFGISLAGTVGRPDKQKLLDLADQCLDRGKHRLILDLSQLSAIGGGGAKILAEFQERLVSSKGEAVFVGAGTVVRRFLQQKFEALPLRFFPNVSDAENHFDDLEYRFDPDEADAQAEAERNAVPSAAPEAADASNGQDTLGEVGATAAVDPDDDADDDECDEGSLAMNEVLDEFNGSDEEEATQNGRRKDHHYTSLSEAMEALAGWSACEGQAVFAVALRNLLFSHGLAENAVLLTPQDDLLVDDEQRYEIPLDGNLAQQVAAATEQPLTMLDIQTGDLSLAETHILEELMPALLLPVRRADRLEAIILVVRNDADEEYTVAEHFALELLMRTLAGERPDARGAGAAPATPVVAAVKGAPQAESSPSAEPPSRTWQAVARSDGDTSNVLLNLALNLPEADDRPHFWRLFARHIWPILPVASLGFVAPGMHRALVISGDSDNWKSLHLGEEKLRHFFRSMQRPVKVENLPAFFQDTKAGLAEAGAEWIVGLTWEEEFLGTVFMSTEESFNEADPEPLLIEIFNETSRLLHRFANSNESADVSLELVKILVAQREKRCYGTDSLTDDLVAHVRRLARVMGFAPDQERDLVYGCVLRDVGLMDKEDALMGPADQLDPIQGPVYRRHPTEGAALLAGLNLPQTINDVVYAHHERFDGKGFPRGTAGRKIPLAARVVAVVETYVSMVVGSAGRKPLGPEEAAEVLRHDEGARFDPDVVEVFLKAIHPTDRSDSEVQPSTADGKPLQRT